MAKDNIDYYKILGVPQTASQNDIKKVYRMQLKRWLPDKNPDNKKEAEEKSKEIMEAYKLLSNKNKCDLYDGSLKDIQKETEVLPPCGDGKISMTEREPHAKADKLSSDNSLSSEKSSESFFAYEESTFESCDDLYSEDNLSQRSEELFGQARESSSESSSKSENLTLKSNFESRDTSPESNKSLQSHMCSKSHKNNQKNKLFPRKKDLAAKKHQSQDGRNGLPAVTPEQHAKSQSIKKPFPENSECYTWKSKSQSQKNKPCPGKNKQYEYWESNTGGEKHPKLKTEPCSREDKPYSGKKKKHTSVMHTKNELLKEKADGHIGKYKMKIKKSLTVKNRSYTRFEHTKRSIHNAEQKELLDESESGIRYLRYTRRKVSPSIRQDTQPGNTAWQFQKSGLQAGNRRTCFQKSELHTERSKLHAGKSDMDVQMRELLFWKNKMNVQTKYLHKERNNKEVRELHDGKNKLLVQNSKLCDERGNKAVFQFKELMTEADEKGYSWKIPPTVCISPGENAAELFLGETTPFSDGQAPLLGNRRPCTATQSWTGNQWANFQAWNKIYQLHNRKILLPYINMKFQNRKNCSPYLNNQLLSNMQTEILNPPVLCSCPRCSQWWFKWFPNYL